MNIYLIGLPGSGKSTLGKELARLLHYQFTDTDTELERSENKTIEAIFELHGEDYFRKAEQATLFRVSKNNNQVISTGGGLPCFFNNMRFINENGISVYIDVPIETLTARITNSHGNIRPMVKNKSKAEVIEFLTAKKNERGIFYDQAKIKVSGSNITLKDISKFLEKIN